MQFDPDHVSRAFGRAVSAHHVSAIDPHLRIHSVTGGVYRVTADGGDTAVVKVIRHGVDADPGALWVAGDDPAHRNYWKREWLAFDTGLLTDLPGRLRAPRTLLTTQRSDDECHVWMEDVRGRTGPSLTLDDYRHAAYDLGTTQRACSAAVPQPEWQSRHWLSRHWLRGWVDVCARYIDVAYDDDRLAPMRRLRDRIGQLWDRRDELLAIIDSAPQTLVHCDFWPTNVIAADDGTTVAIDWSQVGIGALAQDIDQLTLDPVWMQVRPDESLDRLEDIVLTAYAEGAHIEVEQVRHWYAAAAGAHYPWVAGAHATRVDDPAELEARFGRSYADITADRARVIERALDLGEWALHG